MRSSHLARAVLAGWLVQAAVSADSFRLASSADACVLRDKAADSWTIGNEAIALTVGFDRAGEFGVVALVEPASGRRWNVGRAPDAWLGIGHFQIAVGSRAEGFVLRGFEAGATEAGPPLSAHILILRVQPGGSALWRRP